MVALFAELKWGAEEKRKEKKNNNKMEKRVRGKGKKMEPYQVRCQIYPPYFFCSENYTKHQKSGCK